MVVIALLVTEIVVIVLLVTEIVVIALLVTEMVVIALLVTEMVVIALLVTEMVVIALLVTEIVVIALLVTEVVVGSRHSPGWLPVVPLMLSVRVHVKVVLLRGAVLVPLLLAVTLLPAVGAVVHAEFDLRGEGHSLGDRHHRLTADNFVLHLRGTRHLSFLANFV
jgi:hypothetical protein